MNKPTQDNLLFILYTSFLKEKPLIQMGGSQDHTMTLALLNVSLKCTRKRYDWCTGQILQVLQVSNKLQLGLKICQKLELLHLFKQLSRCNSTICLFVRFNTILTLFQLYRSTDQNVNHWYVCGLLLPFSYLPFSCLSQHAQVALPHCHRRQQ